MGGSLRAALWGARGWACACGLFTPTVWAQPEREPPPAPLEIVVEEAEPPPASLAPPPAATKPPVVSAPSAPESASAPASSVTLFNNAAGKLTVSGYAEFYYSYNFNAPPNGITNFRAFDNRHNSFTLSNSVLDTQYEKAGLQARLALQFGHTPNAIGIVEPSAAGTGSVGPSDGNTWKYIQQAYIGYKLPVRKGLYLQAGIFLTPIGLEPLPVKDNWNWSRSNLFMVLPFYHAGIRATQQLTDYLSLTVMVFNGWNNVIDSNIGKSVGVQLSYLDVESVSFSVMYFGGSEHADRPLLNVTVDPAAEGQPWRSLFDAWVQWKAARRLWFGAHFDGGFELTNFGISSWAAGALYARVQATRWLFFAARGDAFFEHAAHDGTHQAARIFWLGDWVSSATGTVDLQILDGFMARIEYRHDHAQANMYFSELDPSTPKDILITPILNSQDTITFGVLAWF